MSNYTIDSLQTENIVFQTNNEKLMSKMEREQSELLKLRNQNGKLRDDSDYNKLYIGALSNDSRELQREYHLLMDGNGHSKEMNDKNIEINHKIHHHQKTWHKKKSYYCVEDTVFMVIVHERFIKWYIITWRTSILTIL